MLIRQTGVRLLLAAAGLLCATVLAPPQADAEGFVLDLAPLAPDNLRKAFASLQPYVGTGLGVKAGPEVAQNGVVAGPFGGTHTDDLFIHAFTIGLRWAF